MRGVKWDCGESLRWDEGSQVGLGRVTWVGRVSSVVLGRTPGGPLASTCQADAVGSVVVGEHGPCSSWAVRPRVCLETAPDCDSMACQVVLGPFCLLELV